MTIPLLDPLEEKFNRQVMTKEKDRKFGLVADAVITFTYRVDFTTYSLIMHREQLADGRYSERFTAQMRDSRGQLLQDFIHASTDPSELMTWLTSPATGVEGGNLTHHEALYLFGRYHICCGL